MQEHDARTDADRWHPATERPSELPGADRATSSSLFTSLSLSLPVTVQAALLRIWPNQSFNQQRRRRKVGTVRLCNYTAQNDSEQSLALQVELERWTRPA